MKCVKIKGPMSLVVDDIEETKADGSSVVIDVKKCGICGSDIHYWDLGSPEELVMGHEFCGVVTDPGSREDLKVGDRVTGLPISPCGECPSCKSGNPQYCLKTWDKAVGLSLTNPGAYALKTKVRPDMVIKVPDNVTDEEVAMVEPTAVALHAVHLANIKVGDRVLVIGGGIIGELSAMLAKKEGAYYVAMSETNEKRGEKSVKLGCADEYFNALDEEFMTKAKAKCPYGYDVVIECCGNSPAVTSSQMMVRPNGTVVLVGVSMKPIEVPTIITVMHELKVYGAIAYTYEEFEECINLMATKQIDVTKFVDDIVGLDSVQHAFERLTSGNDDAIKILIDPSK